MWIKCKAILRSIRGFFVGMLSNATDNAEKAVKVLGWVIVPVIAIAIYVLMMLPQLAVFAVISSFTSGIQDPILKFMAGIFVFSAMEFILMIGGWIVVCILGLPEMLRFAAYVKLSFLRRVAEEEERESQGKDLTLRSAYESLKSHQIPEPEDI